MKRAFPFFVIFVAVGLLLWAFPFFSVALSAPTQDVDLVIGKSDYPDPVIAGNALTYTLEVTNSGDILATDVALTDTLPSQVTFNAASPLCSYNAGTGRVRCDLPDLEALASSSVTITVQVDPSARGSITNTARVNPLEADIDLSNNIVTETTTINASADLSLSKLDDPDPVNFGDILTYTLTVANGGPSNSVGVSISDTLPAGTAFDDQSSSPECAVLGSIVTCSLGNIAAGGNRLVRVRVNVLTSETITNSASISGVTPDPDTNDQRAQVVTAVNIGSPVAHWSAPVQNEFNFFVDCQTVHLEVSADDPIQRVDFKRWDHVIIDWIPIGSDLVSPYTWELDTCVLPFGFNQIWAWAYDSLNNRFPGIRIFLVKLAYIYMPNVKR